MRNNFLLFSTLAMIVVGPGVVFAADNSAPAQDCAQLCKNQLYEESFACRIKNLNGIVERAKGFGDIAIVTGTCAYNNGDFDIAQKFGDMSFTDHPMVWAVLKATPGKGGSAHRMFITEAAAEKLGQSDKAEHYKTKGIEYAKNSGQCEGAKNSSDAKALEKCAEGYRDDIRNTLKATPGKGGGKLTDVKKIYDAFEAFCGANQEFDVSELSCKCFDGYKKEANSKNCVLNTPSTFDQDSATDFQIAVERMPKNSYLKATVKDRAGKTFEIGVIKQNTGKTIFTTDGKDFFKDLDKEFYPPMTKRISDAWTWLSERPGKILDWASHTKWKDDEEGQYKELQWQIANEVLEDYKSQMKEELFLFENFRKKVEEYNGYLEWFKSIKELSDDVDDTGMSIHDFAEDKIDSVFEAVKDYGATFPGAAIEKFVSEASVEAFSKPVIFYIGERRQGKTAQQIRTEDPDEMTVPVSQFVFNTFGDNLWDKYEESYQRFLLAREFDRKK